MLRPRDKGLAFTTPFKKLHIISVGETIQLYNMSVTGAKTTRGKLHLKFGTFSKR